MQPLWGSYVRFYWSYLVAKGALVRWIRLLEHNPRATHFCINLCIGHEGWFWCIIADLPLRHRDICHLAHLQVMEAVMTEFDSWASWSERHLSDILWHFESRFLLVLIVFKLYLQRRLCRNFFGETLCKKETKISFFYGCWQSQFTKETLPNFFLGVVNLWRVMATSSNESSLFNIEKLDGTNFPFGKEQIYNVLVQKKQVKPIKLKGVKPKGRIGMIWMS